MRRVGAGVAAAALALGACRTAGPIAKPAGPTETAGAMASVVSARDEAWRPRRFKALFRGELSPGAGVAVRGFLAFRWDGTSLFWTASVPLAGAGRSGVLRREGGDLAALLPGRLAASDVLAALLGVPEELPVADGAELRGDRVVLRLPSGEGREVLVTPAAGVTGLVLPEGVRVELTPGAGVPRRIAIRGPEGSAVLTLESYAPWPEGEGGA